MKYDFLISKLKSLVASERKITAEIIELIREIDHKRIYLEYGHTSMFAMLTKDFGYTPAAAMRRIDAARLFKELPEINESLKSGDINLSQISMLAQAVRQKQKEQLLKAQVSKAQVSKETKVFLLEKVKSLDLVATQKTLASHLDLEVKTHEKKTYQKDETLRMEITLSKSLQQDLERLKELISHQNPNPTMAELIQFLANHFLNNKDPLRKKTPHKKEVKSEVQVERKEINMARKTSCKESAYAGTVPASRQKHRDDVEAATVNPKDINKRQSLVRPQKSSSNRYIPIKIKQQIFQRDQSCQWTQKIIDADGKSIHRKCGSKFQLQIDHIQPKWLNGTNEQQNLQLLCGIHNKLKYQREILE